MSRCRSALLPSTILPAAITAENTIATLEAIAAAVMTYVEANPNATDTIELHVVVEIPKASYLVMWNALQDPPSNYMRTHLGSLSLSPEASKTIQCCGVSLAFDGDRCLIGAVFQEAHVHFMERVFRRRGSSPVAA